MESLPEMVFSAGASREGYGDIMREQEFATRTAIVTGGAHGIGAATAELLATRGAEVIVGDIDVEGGTSTVERIVSTGARAHFVRCDVSSSDDWMMLADAARRLTGRIDHVANNAYALTVAPAHEQTVAQVERQIGVSVGQVFHCVRACIADLQAARGSMTVTSSIHALQGSRGYSAYAASKGAIGALVRQLASEYAPLVRVNAVLPGAVLTQAWDGVDERSRERYAHTIALERFAQPREIATAIAFLLSDDASYITGENLVVDGGVTSALAWDRMTTEGTAQ